MDSATSKRMTLDYIDADLIIVGCGLSGLISAVKCAKEGLKVKVIEASDRAGGKILSRYFPETGNVIELGAEYFDSELHIHTIRELTERKFPFELNSQRNYYFMDNKNVFSEQNFNNILQSNREYINALNKMNYDIQNLFINRESIANDRVSLDCSYALYVEETLQVTDLIVKEYLLHQCFLLSGVDAYTQSTMQLFTLFSKFGLVENAFQKILSPAKLSEGIPMSVWIDSLLEEFICLGGEVHYNQPVLSISLLEFPPKNLQIPKYDFADPHNQLPNYKIHIYLATGISLYSRAVIVAIPLKCIPSIQFTPSLPDTILRAGQRCDVSRLQKSYAKVTNVTQRIDQILTWRNPCRVTSKVIAIPVSSHTTTNLSSTRHLSNPIHLLKANGQFDFIMKIIGIREDIEENVENNLEELYPKIIYSKIPIENGNLIDLKRHQILERQHSEIEMKMISHRNTNLNLLSPFYRVKNDILFHDFVGDPYARSSWFGINAGTKYLHSDACRDSHSPWIQTKGLRISGSDLSIEWTGWLEGAVVSGGDAADQIIRYLNPPMISRNEIRRIYPIKRVLHTVKSTVTENK